MDFGISMAPGVESWKVAKRAEELGFSHAWFFDTQMLCADVFVAMTTAALNTSRIKLGTGVLVPSNRIAPTTAGSLASLNQIAPGRIILGIGTGHTARRTMGLNPVRLDEMREHIRIIRELLAGRRTEWDFESKHRAIQLMNPELGLINIDDDVPIHVSAMGPRSQRLAAEIADGWITVRSQLPLAIEDLAGFQKEVRAAGRDPSDVYSTAFTFGSVLADGEAYDSPRAKAQAGPQASSLLHRLVEGSLSIELPPEVEQALAAYRKLYESYDPPESRYILNHTGHLMFLRPEERDLITGDVIKHLTFTGPEDEMVDRIRSLRDAGYDQWVVNIPPGQESALEDWARVIERV